MSLMQREELLRRLSVNEIADRLFVVPLLDSAEQVNEGSIDLRLGSAFIESRRRAESVIDPFLPAHPSDEDHDDRYEVPFGECLVIHPGQFLLGSTFEFIRLPLNVGGQVLSRSSWGRFGLIVATAVTVHPGFAGCLTLELQNLGTVPIKLYPGLRIAQIMLWTTTGPLQGAPPSEPPPLGPVSRKQGWNPGEVERIRLVQAGLSGPLPASTSSPTLPTSMAEPGRRGRGDGVRRVRMSATTAGATPWRLRTKWVDRVRRSFAQYWRKLWFRERH